MLVDYISNLKNAAELCDEFEHSVLSVFFKEGKVPKSTIPNIHSHEYYQECFRPIKAFIDMCKIIKLESLKKYEPFFHKRASSLESGGKIDTLEDFKSHVETIKIASKIAQGEIVVFCSAFDEEEKKRTNEAIHDYLEDCNYSCVAMSVSAVESRLVKLMCLASPDSEPELREKTLGQLTFEYLENKEKYKKVVPKRHEHLLQLCNDYRTFSVHPKGEKIKPTIAGSILNFAIEFLTDQDTKPEIAKAQLTA